VNGSDQFPKIVSRETIIAEIGRNDLGGQFKEVLLIGHRAISFFGIGAWSCGWMERSIAMRVRIHILVPMNAVGYAV